MKRRRLLKGTLKWGCTASMVAIATVWLGSSRWGFAWKSAARGRDDGASVQCGALLARWYPAPPGFGMPPEFVVPPGFDFGPLPPALRQSGMWMWKPQWHRHPNGSSLVLPLWLPTGLLLIPTALLWYTDRRHFGPGRCVKCGYDRRGLPPDAKCPECGTVPAPASK